MSSTSWQHSESNQIPVTAPALRPPPHHVPKLNLSEADSQGLAGEFEAAAAEATAEAPNVKGLLQKNLRRASITIKAHGQVADLTEQLAHQVRENPSTKVAEEHALRAGQLSGARVCQALLQGEMRPESFALCVAEMPRQLLHQWMENFARCVSLLGETVVSLQRQIQV